MKLDRSYILPLFLATMLHGLVLWIFIFEWQLSINTNPPIIIKQRIHASLVDLNTMVPQRSPQNTQVLEQRQAEAKRQMEAKRQTDAKRQIEAKRQAEEKIRVEAFAQAHRDEALSQILEDELEYEQLIRDQQAVQNFSDYILQSVTKKWSRPAIARVGMTVKLRIYLLPTGEVKQVDIVESSRNDAFDQSAVRAVNRVGRFGALINLAPRLFDAQFRKFILDFDPGDLRL